LECCKFQNDVLDQCSPVLTKSRSEFDHILLKHASSCGVQVFEKIKVTTIEFEKQDKPKSRPIAVTYTDLHGEEGHITFNYLIDASGRHGIMSTKYLKNRITNPNLKNTAIWGYWENFDRYKPGTERDDAVWIEALTG